MKLILKTLRVRKLGLPQSFYFTKLNLKKYTKDHEWIYLENDIATVGITDFAQSELGEIVHVELPKIGTKYNEGDSLGAIESVKTAADIYNPIEGTIVETNEKLTKTPKLLNTHPYSQGWYAKLKVEGIQGEDFLKTLMSEEDYLKLIETSKK